MVTTRSLATREYGALLGQYIHTMYTIYFVIRSCICNQFTFLLPYSLLTFDATITIITPNVGIEPTTTRLRVVRSTD